MYGPFAETSPHGLTGWIDEDDVPVVDHFRRLLGFLNGQEQYTYSIWRAPNPESIVVTHRDVGETFIQAAGSSEGITVEVRLVGEDGVGHLYTLGHTEPRSDATVLIPINDQLAVRVFSNEVFTADEAAEIFAEFYRTEDVAETYVLRELDLSQDQSVPR